MLINNALLVSSASCTSSKLRLRQAQARVRRRGEALHPWRRRLALTREGNRTAVRASVDAEENRVSTRGIVLSGL